MNQLENSSVGLLKLKKQNLISKLYTNQNGMIVKEIIANEQMRKFYEEEILLQQTAASKQIAINIINFGYDKKDLKLLLRITYDCDASCIPIFELENVSMETKIEISQQILAICGFIYRTQISHRNIKPSNVLFYQGQVLLTDFGSHRTFFYNFQRQYENANRSKWREHFLYYQCPEYLNWIKDNAGLDFGENDLPSKKPVWADIWSLGIIVLELFVNRQSTAIKRDLYYGLNERELKKQLNPENWKASCKGVCIALEKLLIQKYTPEKALEELLKNIQPKMRSQRISIINQSIVQFQESLPKLERFIPVPTENQIFTSARIIFERMIGQNNEESNLPPAPPQILEAISVIIPSQQMQQQSSRSEIKIDKITLNPLNDTLNELLSHLRESERNQTLTDFLSNQTNQTDCIPSFHTLKQLSLEECKKLLEKLNQMLKYHNNRESRVLVQRLFDIKKCKGNIFLTECRIKALKTLENKRKFPENQIIYLMNIDELLYINNMKDKMENCKSLDGKIIKNYLDLQQKIEENDVQGIHSLDLLTIAQLEILSTNDYYKQQEIQFYVDRKKQAQLQYGIEQFDFYEKLYERNNYDKFIDEGDTQYRLSRKEFELLDGQLQEEYKQKLLYFGRKNENNRDQYLESIKQIHNYRLTPYVVPVEWLQEAIFPRLLSFFNFAFRKNLELQEFANLRNYDAKRVEKKQEIFKKGYAGQLFENEFHGLGLRLQGKGEFFYGYFCFGSIFYGQFYQQASELNFVTYTGYFKDGKKHGQGIMNSYRYTDRFIQISEYDGKFAENEMSGLGCLKDYDKNQMSKGQFLNNQFDGEITIYEGFKETQTYKICQYYQGRQIGSPKFYEEGQLIARTEQEQSSNCSIM